MKYFDKSQKSEKSIDSEKKGYVKLKISHIWEYKEVGNLVNVDRIRSILTEKGISVSDISEKIGINRSTFYRKLNRKGADFTIKEVDAISKELNLTWDEVVSIFFSASLSRKWEFKGRQRKEVG